MAKRGHVSNVAAIVALYPSTLSKYARLARAIVRRLAVATGFTRDGVHARIVREPMNAPGDSRRRMASLARQLGKLLFRDRHVSSDRTINFKSHMDSGTAGRPFRGDNYPVSSSPVCTRRALNVARRPR